MAENVIFGGFHRQAWVVACAWVIFACCRGYGGNSKHVKYLFLNTVTLSNFHPPLHKSH